mmetsp:Transcript_17576/g.23457  ORF Transcript_17576/g.23457 Transcript_17576/m.23457 type:complete len:129 (+) Transcript_17576:69-455(+)
MVIRMIELAFESPCEESTSRIFSKRIYSIRLFSVNALQNNAIRNVPRSTRRFKLKNRTQINHQYTVITRGAKCVCVIASLVLKEQKQLSCEELASIQHRREDARVTFSNHPYSLNRLHRNNEKKSAEK